MKRKLISAALVACMPYAAQAQTETVTPRAAADGADKDQLLALLEEQTAIATRTRMNIDYVPGMVTVLHGDDLEARGARTVWEALSLVPGMEMAMEKTGRRKVLVRGLGNTWASGNVKILLNDVSMNSAEFGLADPLFNIPVEQIDRIEVIRGPGSALYGEYAYMGVINVITRSDQSRAYVFGGSFDTRGAGVTATYSPSESPLKASLNVGGWRSSGADVQTGIDSLGFYGYQEQSYAPGPANEDIDSANAVFKLDYQRFSFVAQQSEDGLGDHFGLNSFLPPDSDRIAERWRHRNITMRREIPLSSALDAGIEMGWKNIEHRRSDMYVGPAALYMQEGDVYLSQRYRETNMGLGADATYRGWNKHTALVAASANNTHVDENWITFNQNVGPAVTIPEGASRTIKAVTVQDEYRHSDVFTLTVGARYDEYSDFGHNYSPRIAGVWRFNEHHILKAQYAEAFRPPALFELNSSLYFSRDIQPAQIKTSELGYIFKGDRAEARVTSFYSRLDELIVYGDAGFGNEGARVKGLEWEQALHLTPHWAFDGNISFVDTEDEETGEPFPGAARWIANVGPSYKRGDATIVLQGHYVSGYEREQSDTRPELDGYTTIDLTTSIAHVLAEGVYMRFGIKNLFDEDVRFPSTYGNYPEDHPRPGRSWWAQVSYRY